MNSFFIAILVMFGLAFLFLLPPLLRGQKNLADRSKDELANEMTEQSMNVAIGREQLTALENELAAGEIDEQQFQQARQELEFSLAQALSTSTRQTEKTNRHVWLSLGIFISLPLLALLLYLQLGTPQVFSPQVQSSPEPQMSAQSMIASLEEHLQGHSSDGEAWMILGQAYLRTEQFAKAEQAFKQAYEILGDHAELLANYADAIGRGNNNQLTGAAKPLIERALEIEPGHQKTLWLAGMLTYQEGNYDQVAGFLQPLLSQTDPNSEVHQSLSRLIGLAEERSRSANQAVPLNNQKVATEEISKTDNIRLQVHVALAPGLHDQADPEDTVFIFAKALQGPPMPLAVVRLQVKDLPAMVTLDDSKALRPDRTISGQALVLISARISKSGNAIASKGDLQAQGKRIETAQQEPIELLIDQRIP